MRLQLRLLSILCSIAVTIHATDDQAPSLNNSQAIIIKNTNKEYSLKHSFYIDVENKSKSQLVFSISIEMLVDANKWAEVKGDIFNYSQTKKTRLIKILKHTTKMEVFYPGQYLTFNHNYYRLRINYGSDYLEKSGTSYSGVFKFTK